MPIISLTTLVAAPLQRTFDLARSIDLHVESMAHTGERAIAGVTSGVVVLGDEVTWEGRHLGVRQRFTSRITAFDEPRYFQDSMVKGAFASYVHDHHFEIAGAGTLMRDELRFRAPLGLLGVIAERVVLIAYMRRLLEERNRTIKLAAERG